MYPHRIRLRGPWECEPLDSPSGVVPASFRVTVPCRWHDAGLPNFAGRVRYRRRFGYPGRIDDVEHVWLTFAGASDSVEVSLNGIVLGRGNKPDGPFELEVTPLLQARNELVAEVTGTAPTAGLWGEVALEIRRAAFLHEIRIEPIIDDDSVHLRVTGEVAGSATGLLELYLLLDRSTIAYKTVIVGSFEIISDAVSLAQWRSMSRSQLTLDLVQGAVVWYRVEQELATDYGLRTTDH